MSDKSIGFIGAGRVAKILLSGWARAGAMPRRVVLFDPSVEACGALKTLSKCIEASTAVTAAEQDVVFLAVHPPVLKDAAAAIQPALRDNAILVSLAPKFSITRLTEMLGGFARITRVIPNAPSCIGRGYNPVVYGAALSSEDKAVIEELLGSLGAYPEVPEAHLEAYAILSAMGPTYFWPQLYELASLAETFGLGRAAALEALDKMLWGAVATMRESGLSPEEVQDLIPVKPVAEDVAVLASAYRTKLTGLMEKLKP